MSDALTGGLEGKVALVTGAGGERGFGRAIARQLAADGADVVVNDVRAVPYGAPDGAWGGVEAVAEEIRALGRRSLAVVADVADAEAVDAMVARTVAQLGRLDILVCNAGSLPGPDRVPVVDLTEEAFDQVQRVNVKGTFLTARAGARHMLSRPGGGRVIITASTAGKRGLARYAAYTASKFALVGFTQVLAHELGPHGITVNAVCPGLADTERALLIADALKSDGGSAEEQLAMMLRQRAATAPLRRATTAQDVADAVAFFASERASFLTGLALPVAGGEVMG
jgi:NAD(P)-dependent dehydrogenase (short-subunit alcohol dehydrogenase family)